MHPKKPNSKAQSKKKIIVKHSPSGTRLSSLCTQELREIWQRAENSRWKAWEGAGTLHTNPLNHGIEQPYNQPQTLPTKPKLLKVSAWIEP